LIQAQTDTFSRWSDPATFSHFLFLLNSLNFSDFDARRRALALLSALRLPQFFFTYSFNPTVYPVLPPIPQTRFPASLTYILLDTAEYQGPLVTIQASLSYRDSDGPIDTPLSNYQDALLQLQTAYDANTSFFDQFSYETNRNLVWAPYPPPFRAN
jgi:hypothetical protein